MTNPQHPPEPQGGEPDEHATDARSDWDAAYTGDVPETPVDADLIGAEASFEVADIATWRPDPEFDLVALETAHTAADLLSFGAGS